ncbi:TetR-like C-terminal domain-containing protein [Nonomuraea wenchangensis]|uniref:TetR-like C-terminal domain-containing protein n=1 Tax=Nonomuraea wenchangensis TaxID=568860 RepID=UPI003796B15A
MNAWRGYAQEHPGRYAAMIQTLRPELAEAGRGLVDIALAVLRAYGLEGEDALHATRCMRAAVHGFAVLESAGAFGSRVELTPRRQVMVSVDTPLAFVNPVLRHCNSPACASVMTCSALRPWNRPWVTCR